MGSNKKMPKATTTTKKTKTAKVSTKVETVAKTSPPKAVDAGVVKKKKRVKVEGQPKRAMNGYMLFRNDVYTDVVSKNPGKPVTEIAKLIGEQWKALADKSKYTALAA